MELSWLFGAASVILIAVVTYATLRSGRFLRTWIPDRNLMLSLPDNLARCSLLLISLLVGYLLGPGPDQLGWQTENLARDLLVGIAVSVPLAMALNLAGQAAIRRWGRGVYSSRLLQCILPINRREWIGVAIALLPAVALEEVIYRSLPLGGLRSGATLHGWLASPWLLLWPLALLFGVAHWPQGAWGVAGATVAAVLFSWLFLVTGSIWTPLAAHYAMNIQQLVFAKRSGLSPLRSAINDLPTGRPQPLR